MTDSVDESPFLKRAKAEIDRCVLSDPDEMYDGMLADALMELLEVFSKQGHSGYSAQITASAFKDLAIGKNLAPITDDPEEWEEIGEDLWHNLRNSSFFSEDGGKTYWDNNVGRDIVHHSQDMNWNNHASDKLDEYQWLLDMGEINVSEFLQYAESLKDAVSNCPPQLERLEALMQHMREKHPQWSATDDTIRLPNSIE